MRIFTIAEVPDDLQQRWLQHLRDFDAGNPGCHFQVVADAPPDMPLEEMVEKLRIDPALTFTRIFERQMESPEFRQGLALAALARRKEQAKHLEPFLPRNEELPAGAPMHYRCVECGMPYFVDEEWVEKQDHCGECMFLIDQGWLLP